MTTIDKWSKFPRENSTVLTLSNTRVFTAPFTFNKFHFRNNLLAVLPNDNSQPILSVSFCVLSPLWLRMATRYDSRTCFYILWKRLIRFSNASHTCEWMCGFCVTFCKWLKFLNTNEPDTRFMRVLSLRSEWMEREKNQLNPSRLEFSVRLDERTSRMTIRKIIWNTTCERPWNAIVRKIFSSACFRKEILRHRKAF